MADHASEPGPEPGAAPPPKRKDWWDKADVVLKPLGGVLTAAIIALLGFWTQDYLRTQAEQDTRVRLYNQLLSEREKAESQLRSTMFSKIIDSFVGSGNEPEPEDQLLYLELLVQNFHESLNLAPLFSHLQRQIHASEGAGGALSERLSDLAREVGRKQLMALVPHGDVRESWFLFEKTRNGSDVVVTPLDGGGAAGDPKLIAETVLEVGDGVTECPIGTPADGAAHDAEPGGETGREAGDGVKACQIRVRMYLEDVDPVNLRLKIRTEVQDELLQGQNPPEFWLDHFDFPMIDNTRLSGGYRLALVLTDFGTSEQGDAIQGAARTAVVAFPEEYASLKDRTFLQDVLDDLSSQPR